MKNINQALRRTVSKRTVFEGSVTVSYLHSRFVLVVEFDQNGVESAVLISELDGSETQINEEQDLEIVRITIKDIINEKREEFNNEWGEWNKGCDDYHAQKEDSI